MPNQIIVNESASGLYERTLDAGLRLAELPEEQGGWLEYFSESDAGDLRIEDDYLRASTALMLENCKHWMYTISRGQRLDNGLIAINEATRSALVGGFSDYLFPIIRAAFPTNPLNDIVSVQPTNRKVATVVYWNWVFGSNKGSFTKGARMFDANTGTANPNFHYTDNVIDAEVFTPTRSNGAGTNDVASGTLAYHDGGGIIPGSVQITIPLSATVGEITDNANGGLVAHAADGTLISVDASSINYQTGAWSIDIAHATDTFGSGTATATYAWDSEGSSSLPEVDIQIITSTTQTQRRALKINYSIESMQDVMQEVGQSLEPQLVTGAAERLNFEIARQIVSQIWLMASVKSTFVIAAPTGISQQEHFRDIIYNLNQASNDIWLRTQKGYGNWIIVDEGAANVIESLPNTMFVPAPRPANTMGLHYIGTLNGKFRVYKDVHLVNETGAAAAGNILMGYKGNNFFEAGFVWSPYQMLYTTEAVTLADFLTQRGMASRYATKMVNSDMYVRINLAATA